MNGVYLRRLSLEEFARQATPFLEKNLPLEVSRPLDANYVLQIVPLIQERAKTLDEVPQLSEFFFSVELEYDIGLLLGKIGGSVAIQALRVTMERLDKLESWDAASMEDVLRRLAVELELTTRDFFGLLRVATTGQSAAPPLFQTMEVLGRGQCFKRLNVALDRLSEA